MNKNEIKIGDRLYHEVFGWCKVTHPVNNANKTLIDLEADEVSYYVLGKGRLSYSRNKGVNAGSNQNIVLVPIHELHKDEKFVHPPMYGLKMQALGVELKYWK